MSTDTPRGMMFSDLCEYLEDDALAAQIIEKFGGQRVAVPKKLTADHPFSIALGFAAAQRLTEVFGGERVEIPRQRFSKKQRAAYILDLDRRGVRRNEIAQRAGCTVRWVRMVLREAAERGVVQAKISPKAEAFPRSVKA